jgi:hypothetical protein
MDLAGETLQDFTKLDKKQLAFIESMKSLLGNITKSCDAIGISRRTYYNWMEDENFKNEVDSIDEFTLDFVENSLFKQIQEGNTTATIFYLKTKGRGRGYIERVHNEVTITEQPLFPD